MSQTAPAEVPAPSRQLPILLTVCLGTIVLPLSITGMGVAIPEIGGSLHASLTSLQWALNGYSLVFTSLLLVSGSLADMFGRRRMFRIGTALFAAGSLACALAGDSVLLEIGRVVAGIGAAIAVPSGSATLATVFQGPARAKAFGVFGTTLGVGLAVGPSASGLLVDHLGWRSVFALPALCALGACALSVLLPESNNPNHRKLDWVGTITYTAALFALVFAVIEGPQAGWGSVQALGGLIAAAVLLAVFVVVERRQAQPVLDLGLLTNPTFLGLSLRVVITVLAFSPLLTYLPSYLVGAQGRSPQAAGLVMLLLTAPIVVLPTVAGYLAKWITPMTQVVLILVVGGAGLAWLTVIGPDPSTLTIAGPLLLFGLSMGISFGLSDATVLSAIPAERAGMAAGLFNTMRLGGEAMGIAVFGSMLISLTGSRLAEQPASALGPYAHRTGELANAVNGGQLDHALDGLTPEVAAAAHAATTTAYTSALHVVLWTMAALSLVGAPLVAGLIRRGRRSEARATPVPETARTSDKAVPQPAGR